MPVVESVEAWDDESYDDETWIESYDDEAEDDDEAEFLGPLLAGPAAAIGGAINSLFGGPARPVRPPLPRVSVAVPGPGVASATLSTPAGNATLRLPEPVVTRREFEASVRRLQDGINRDASRVNAVARDLDTLRARVGVVVTDTQRDVGKLRSALTKQQRATRAALARMRREQSQQQMMSMVMGILAQRSAAEQLEEHTHAGPSGRVVDSDNDSSDSTMLMLLPMMMTSQGGGGDSSSMMLPMMMLAMSKG